MAFARDLRGALLACVVGTCWIVHGEERLHIRKLSNYLQKLHDRRKEGAIGCVPVCGGAKLKVYCQGLGRNRLARGGRSVIELYARRFVIFSTLIQMIY